MNKILLLTTLVFIACNTRTPNANLNTGTENEQITNPKIVYLYFDAKKKNDEVTIELTQYQNVDGLLKKSTIINQPKNIGNYIIQLQSKTGDIIEERIIENPFKKLLESYAPEGMNTEVVDFKEGHFFVRYTYNKNIKTIEIQEIQENSNKLLFKKILL